MSTILEQIQQELAAFQERKKVLTEQLRNEFPKMFAPLFEKTDKIKSISWSQYTPYFNDGETCEFSVNNTNLEINNVSLDNYDEKEVDLSWFDWRMGHPQYQEELKNNPKLDWEAFAVYKQFQQMLISIPHEMYEDLFGDHVKVTITKNGVDVEEYEHD